MDVIKRMVMFGRIWMCLIVGLALYFGGGMANAASDASQMDVSKIMGPEECGECHKSEVQAWQGSHHFKTFKALVRKKEAKEIAGKMGIKRMKKDSACLSCHFTVGKNKKGKVKPIAGISCESCHSPSKEWVKVHGDCGFTDEKKKIPCDKEAPEHKAQRLAKMESAGMIRPATLYRLAKNCFQCHTVPNEKLVNVGEHTPGSKFELVTWSQGEVRHNFIQSKGKKNEAASPERKRVLYVVGQVLDLEFSFRNLAKATENGKFADSMAKRVMAATGKVKEIQGLVPLPELKEVLAATEGLDLKPNNQSNLEGAANKIGTAAQKLAENQDGTKLAALDKTIPTKYKGEPGKGAPGKGMAGSK